MQLLNDVVHDGLSWLQGLTWGPCETLWGPCVWLMEPWLLEGLYGGLWTHRTEEEVSQHRVLLWPKPWAVYMGWWLRRVARPHPQCLPIISSYRFYFSSVLEVNLTYTKHDR